MSAGGFEETRTHFQLQGANYSAKHPVAAPAFGAHFKRCAPKASTSGRMLTAAGGFRRPEDRVMSDIRQDCVAEHVKTLRAYGRTPFGLGELRSHRDSLTDARGEPPALLPDFCRSRPMTNDLLRNAGGRLSPMDSPHGQYQRFREWADPALRCRDLNLRRKLPTCLTVRAQSHGGLCEEPRSSCLSNRKTAELPQEPDSPPLPLGAHFKRCAPRALRRRSTFSYGRQTGARRSGNRAGRVFIAQFECPQYLPPNP